MKTYTEHKFMISCPCGKAVPKDAGNRDYQEILKEVEEGKAVIVPSPYIEHEGKLF